MVKCSFKQLLYLVEIKNNNNNKQINSRFYFNKPQKKLSCCSLKYCTTVYSLNAIFGIVWKHSIMLLPSLFGCRSKGY